MSHKEIRQLQEEITALQIENRQLKEALKQAQESQAPSLVARLQGEIQRLRGQLQELKPINSNGDKGKAVTQKTLVPTLSDLHTQIARLKDRNQALKVSLEPEQDSAQELIQQLGNKVLSLHEDMKKTIRIYKNQVRETSKKVQAAQHAEKSIELLVKTLEKQVHALESDNRSLRKHIEDSENAYAGVVSKLERQLKSMKYSLGEAEKTAEDLQKQLKAELKEKVAQEQKARKKAEASAKDLQTKIHQLSQYYTELKERYHQEEQAKEALQHKNEWLMSNLEEIRQQLATVSTIQEKEKTKPLPPKESAADDALRSLNIFEI